MKIKFVQMLSTPHGFYPVGAIVDCDDKRAHQLIKDGVVTEWKEEVSRANPKEVATFAESVESRAHSLDSLQDRHDTQTATIHPHEVNPSIVPPEVTQELTDAPHEVTHEPKRGKKS